MKHTFTRSLFFFLSICMVAFSGCEEGEEEINPIVGSWQKVKVEKKTNSTAWTVENRACQLDDVEEYEADGAWTIYDGPSQCGTGSGIIKGTWRFAANGSKIVYTYTGYSGEYESTVESMDGSQMVIVNAVGDTNNTQYRVTYTKK